MLTVGIEHQLVAAVIAQTAKRQGVTVEAAAERFLIAGLKAERNRIVSERAMQWVIQGGAANAIVVPDFCSETFLRQIWGDQWEVGWWLASCALPEPT
jgi:hypothetical protein